MIIALINIQVQLPIPQHPTPHMWELQEHYQLQMKIVGMVTKKKNDVQLAVSWTESEPPLIHTQIRKQQLFSDIKTH